MLAGILALLLPDHEYTDIDVLSISTNKVWCYLASVDERYEAGNLRRLPRTDDG